ncbi:MAG TPA: hypothetical protein VF483_01855 [Gemmatimonadaceae bacterium]
MVLTFKQPWSIELRSVHGPRAISWLMLAAIGALFAWAFLSNQKPGPYGSCYGTHSYSSSCDLPPGKALDPKLVPVQRP